VPELEKLHQLRSALRFAADGTGVELSLAKSDRLVGEIKAAGFTVSAIGFLPVFERAGIEVMEEAGASAGILPVMEPNQSDAVRHPAPVAPEASHDRPIPRASAAVIAIGGAAFALRVRKQRLVAIVQATA